MLWWTCPLSLRFADALPSLKLSAHSVVAFEHCHSMTRDSLSCVTAVLKSECFLLHGEACNLRVTNIISFSSSSPSVSLCLPVCPLSTSKSSGPIPFFLLLPCDFHPLLLLLLLLFVFSGGMYWQSCCSYKVVEKNRNIFSCKNIENVKYYPFSFDPQRKSFSSLIHQHGFFVSGGRVKTWKRRWFILTDNCLYYFEYTTVSVEFDIVTA